MTTDTKASLALLHQELQQSLGNRAPQPTTIDDEAAPARRENSTDATRGEPLVQRAQTRQRELAVRLALLPEEDVRGRTDIETALSTVAGLLTGDLDQISNMTAQALDRWLEANKHLAETAADTVAPAAALSAADASQVPATEAAPSGAPQ